MDGDDDDESNHLRFLSESESPNRKGSPDQMSPSESNRLDLGGDSSNPKEFGSSRTEFGRDDDKCRR